MGIEAIEFLSWNSIEFSLSKSSVDSFIAELIRKWHSGSVPELGELLSFDLEPGTPAHGYEHLQEIELELFRGRLQSRQ
jgi:hypothetical protein